MTIELRPGSMWRDSGPKFPTLVIWSGLDSTLLKTGIAKMLGFVGCQNFELQFSELDWIQRVLDVSRMI